MKRVVRSKLLVGLDASSVAGAVVSRGLGGLRISSFARVPLRAGALEPAPFEPNIQAAPEVKEALTKLRDALGAASRRAILVLPDGLARSLPLDIAPDVSPSDYARFRLASGLSYPVEEAVIETMPLDRGRVLATAVRRSVVKEYEEAAASAGFEQERIDLAPLAALAGLLQRTAGPAPTVDVILGDVAFSMAAFQGGALRVFRNRRRDPGPDEGDRLRAELERTAALLGEGPPPRVRMVGSGAATFIRAFSAAGRSAEPGWDMPRDGLPVEAVELAWLGAVLG